MIQGGVVILRSASNVVLVATTIDANYAQWAKTWPTGAAPYMRLAKASWSGCPAARAAYPGEHLNIACAACWNRWMLGTELCLKTVCLGASYVVWAISDEVSTLQMAERTQVIFERHGLYMSCQPA